MDTIRVRAHHGNWQPQRNRNFREFYQPELNEHMLQNEAAQIEETATQFPQFALLHSGTCSTQADTNSRKSRLRCGCQFLWCTLTVRVK
jgi:hypothetical protein